MIMNMFLYVSISMNSHLKFHIKIIIRANEEFLYTSKTIQLNLPSTMDKCKKKKSTRIKSMISDMNFETVP